MMFSDSDVEHKLKCFLLILVGLCVVIVSALKLRIPI